MHIHVRPWLYVCACVSVHTHVSPWLYICACVSVQTYSFKGKFMPLCLCTVTCVTVGMHPHTCVRDQVAHTVWVCMSHACAFCAAVTVSVGIPHPHRRHLDVLTTFSRWLFWEHWTKPRGYSCCSGRWSCPCCSHGFTALHASVAGSRGARGGFPFEFCSCLWTPLPRLPQHADSEELAAVTHSRIQMFLTDVFIFFFFWGAGGRSIHQIKPGCHRKLQELESQGH